MEIEEQSGTKLRLLDATKQANDVPGVHGVGRMSPPGTFELSGRVDDIVELPIGEAFWLLGAPSNVASRPVER